MENDNKESGGVLHNGGVGGCGSNGIDIDARDAKNKPRRQDMKLSNLTNSTAILVLLFVAVAVAGMCYSGQDSSPIAMLRDSTAPLSRNRQQSIQTDNIHHNSRRRLIEEVNTTTTTTTATGGGDKRRLLYIVTSSSPSYSVGREKRDRLDDMVFPIMLDAVESFVDSNEYKIIDVYMIVSYEFTNEKYDSITSSLQQYKEKANGGIDVGFQVWDNAMPMDYSCRGYKDINDPKTAEKCMNINNRLDQSSRATIQELGAQLARQHRYVVKDKLPYYDIFVNFGKSKFVIMFQFIFIQFSSLENIFNDL